MNTPIEKCHSTAKHLTTPIETIVALVALPPGEIARDYAQRDTAINPKAFAKTMRWKMPKCEGSVTFPDHLKNVSWTISSPSHSRAMVPDVHPVQPPRNSDATVVAHLEKVNESRVLRRVQFVNEDYEEMKVMWPEGTAFDFCVAVELERKEDFHVLKRLLNPGFVAQVIEEAEHRGIKHDHQTQSKSSVRQTSGVGFRRRRQISESSSEEYDDEFTDRGQRPAAAGRWSVRETKRFKEVLAELSSLETGSWKGVQMDQYEGFYHKHWKSGKMKVVFNRRNSPTEIFRKKLKSLLCVEFQFHEKRVFVGRMPERFEQARVTNPLVNYIDQILKEPIILLRPCHPIVMISIISRGRGA
jgi:hypothetical protein